MAVRASAASLETSDSHISMRGYPGAGEVWSILVREHLRILNRLDQFFVVLVEVGGHSELPFQSARYPFLPIPAIRLQPQIGFASLGNHDFLALPGQLAQPRKLRLCFVHIDLH